MAALADAWSIELVYQGVEADHSVRKCHFVYGNTQLRRYTAEKRPCLIVSRLSGNLLHMNAGLQYLQGDKRYVGLINKAIEPKSLTSKLRTHVPS